MERVQCPETQTVGCPEADRDTRYTDREKETDRQRQGEADGRQTENERAKRACRE